ncbi:uncharacterized protein si:ch211-188c18.1 [Anabas testudineus]|uniref:uncharacterized protein si:ch211-188c18.1 n=1 Tax=Anabas testudineus TaxID=64144 RepID=UPI000E45C9FF|nr:uncharacterized protein si:ch211-188c18.1 [Anabas testudineus]
MRNNHSRCHGCNMLLLCWFIPLLCLHVNAEDIALCRELGEDVSLECSSAGCPGSIDGFVGMYLYHFLREKEEVLYYHQDPEPEQITPRQRYQNRIQKEGSLKNHTITISNLTLDDSGVYSCVYKNRLNLDMKCNIYILVVRVPSIIPDEKFPYPVLFMIGAFVAGMLVAMILIKMVVPGVKHCARSRRKMRHAPLPAPNDCVYEVMNKNGLRPSAASEQP